MANKMTLGQFSMPIGIVDCNRNPCTGGTTLTTYATPYVTSYPWSNDVVSLGFAAILFAVAACLIVGARIVWLERIGKATHKPIRKK